MDGFVEPNEEEEGEQPSRAGGLASDLKRFGLSEGEIRELAGFNLSPTWVPFVKLLRYLERQNDGVLRAKSTSDVDLRFTQGRTAQLEELAVLLKSDLPLCYKPIAPKGGA